MNLIEFGYKEIKPNLFMKELDKGIRVYHDFRKGHRWSYAFNDDGPINVKELDEYKQVKMLEEANKCKTLDKWS